MLKLNRRAMIALAAAMASAPAFAQDTPPPGDFSIGSPDAKVKIVEYASFTCPHCAKFHAQVFKDLKRDYIDTGKVYFTLREVYFDRYGLWAGMMARCGGELRYFGITDMLYEQQQEWAASDDPMQVLANLRTIGVAAGLDGAAIDVCLNDQPMAEALVAQFETNMAADDVNGTPTLFVNGTKLPNLSYADLKAVIDAELAK
ncbi:MAG: thiol-disulfide oxidoreductase [Rhodobacterales bacterium 12-65-15]|nr:MAG: thiol-disulfide oxidoreductase [Rhodobacterales bacterium 12-65-15]